MLWFKTFHVLMIIAWMAGIFYLPRIFVHFMAGQNAGEQVTRLKIMGQKLYTFMTIMAVLALASGFYLWFGYGVTGGWLHAKLVMVLGLMVYHFLSWRFLKQMTNDTLKKSETFLRVFNEVPLLLVIAILIFAIVKPF